MPDYEAIFRTIEEDVATVDHDWVITSCNERFARSFGSTPGELVGRTPFEINPAFAKSIFYPPINETLKTGKAAQVLGYSQRADRWLLIRTFPFKDGLACFAHDASELDSRHHQLAQLTRRDPLTGLENRHAFEESVAARINVATPFSAILLDLAHFKQINDTLGHGAGDRALMEFASRFKHCAPNGAQTFRLGGDEFAVLVGGPSDEAAALLPTLLDAAREPIVLSGQSFTLGASVGWVAFPADGDDLSTLMRRADLAVFRSKEIGGAQSAVRYEPLLEQEALNKVKLESALRLALGSTELSLDYKPKIDPRTGRPIGAEALLRWTHPTMGPISPGEFLPLAEERGLMPEIDRWVIERAISDIAQLLRHGIAMPVAINLSATALSDPQAPERIARLLVEHNVPARLFEIEITESDLMIDVDTSIGILNEINKLGVKVSIDDFGTGYSSFAYLLQLPVHALKIDRSFVSKMMDTGSPANRAIVKGIISIAHSMRLSVVAEGVETEEQAQALKRMHCDVMQGYYFSRPLKFRSFLQYVYDAFTNAPQVADPYKT